MAIEDDEDIPEEARKALKAAEEEELRRALDIGLKITMRAQQKLGYSGVMLRMTSNRDVVASVVASASSGQAVYARMDWATGKYQKS